MMAEKARLFEDDEALDDVLDATSPAQAKAIGRRVRNFDDDTWCRHRFAIVVEGSLAKFGQNPLLAKFLLGTGKRVLVEASPPDRVWGIGLAADNTKSLNPRTWRGSNLLGFALMQARTRLRDET
jgi:hypothetical protein